MNRTANVKRKTKETDISVKLDLDGSGKTDISTGVGFFDHMLEQLAKHSLIDMTIKIKGDLHIDAHHTVEDTGLALGQALAEAVGDKTGIARYGHPYVPMDEALARAALDFSGRPYLVFNVDFTREFLGEMDTELFDEFFRAFSQKAGLTLHIDVLHGENNHHMIEATFKAVAKAMRMALEIDPRAADKVPSTKGSL